MKNFRSGLLLCLLLCATAGCDRVTKHLAAATLAGMPGQSFLGDTVRLRYHENPGGFLSTGAEWHSTTRFAVFQVASALFLIAGFAVAVRYQWSRLGAVGITLFLGGALSNWIDRVSFGTVIDFLNIGIGPLRTGVFNVADVAILTGIGILFWEVRRNSYIPAVSTRRG